MYMGILVYRALVIFQGNCGTLELIRAEERPRLWPPLGQL